MISEGLVVLVPFPQVELEFQGKIRPAIVIRRLPGEYDDWLVCMVSSRLIQSLDARTAACKNNLRQFGVAMHNYETSNRHLPPGYRFVADLRGNRSGFSWGSMLLPFIEQEGIQAEFRFDLPLYAPENLVPRERHVSVFLCPTDPISATGFVEMGDERYAMACYVGNFGPPDLDEAQEKREGVFSRNSRTALREIHDGLSTTYMLGERQNGPFRHAGVHGRHFEYETAWAGAIRDIDDPTDDHGHMVLFQSGHPPKHAESDRDLGCG